MAQAAIYLPEIHDLHPGMADRLDRLIGAFPQRAQPLIAYSVVPNWMGTHPLDKAPDFVERLKNLPGSLALHGWTHSQGPDFLNWLLYGHENRSEFGGIDAAETAQRLDKGLAMFSAAGLARPTWFCAPRWTPSASLADALAERGFEGQLARTGLDVGGTHLAVPPLNFDEGSRYWKIAPGRVLRNGQIKRLLGAKKPFRLVLHPDDLDHPKTFAQFEQTVARLEAEGWEPVGLSGLQEVLT
ncbi:MAG: DUF2334 domain-containing protein [Pseudomonadota bacterium]